MKNLLLLLVLLTTAQTVKADEYEGQADAEAGYSRCVNEVSRQHGTDKDISIKEYNGMIKECAFEWQVNDDTDNHKSLGDA